MVMLVGWSGEDMWWRHVEDAVIALQNCLVPSEIFAPQTVDAFIEQTERMTPGNYRNYAFAIIKGRHGDEPSPCGRFCRSFYSDRLRAGNNLLGQ